MKRPELLAPAGNLKKLKIAFRYGADAVYAGLPFFSLRAKTGFDMKSLKQGIKFAHENKKKVFVTVNIFGYNHHIKSLPKHLEALKSELPDAIILSDPGVLQIVRKVLPEAPVHLSTQANTLNYEAVKFWKRQGIKRIILGREASLNDIKKISRNVKAIELETFVHGAMCMSYSGRCYLSAWLNDRSANQGLCTQPCRWEYNVYLEEPKRPGLMIPATKGDQGTFIMNSKDLCLFDHLDKLATAGVDSFKIEGRTKSIYYLATVIRAYRKSIDIISSKQQASKRASTLKEIKKEFDKVDNRGYTTGFLLGNNAKELMNFKDSKGVSGWIFAGEVLDVLSGQASHLASESSTIIKLRVHNVLKNNTTVEVLTPGEIIKVKIKKLRDENDNLVKEARGGAEKWFSFETDNSSIHPGDLVRQKV